MKNRKMFFLRALSFSAFLLSVAFVSCDTESAEIQFDTEQFHLKTGEPVSNMTHNHQIQWLMSSPTGDCRTYAITTTTYIKGIPVYTGVFITNEGPGCPEVVSSPLGFQLNGAPPISRYYYKGRYIEDAEVMGKVGDFYDANPAAYADLLLQLSRL